MRFLNNIHGSEKVKQDIDNRFMTELDPFPILKSEKENGVLYLTLLNYVSFPTTPEENNPEWVGAKDYAFNY